MQFERLSLPAYALRPGDILRPTNRTVLRVVRDGLFMRSQSDQPTRTPFPKNKVEVMVERIGEQPPLVDYWNRGTVVTVDRPTGGESL